MKSDSRISVRISTTELEDIDDFIARHPEFRNRSEFLRIAALKYKEVVDRENNVSVKKYSKDIEGSNGQDSENLVDGDEYLKNNQEASYVSVRIPRDIIFNNLGELVNIGIFPSVENAYQSLFYYIIDKNIFSEFLNVRINTITENIHKIDALKEFMNAHQNFKNRKHAKNERWDE